jgi:hypothetical protein
MLLMARRSGGTPEWRRLGRAGPTEGELELLRAATLPVEAASAAWRRWSASHDIDVAHHRSTDVLPAVSANLPAEVLGEEADRLRGIRRRVWANNQLAFLGLAEAAGILLAHGIVPVVAKGAALVGSVYREPGIRAMADVDFLIGDERFEEARDLLLQAGWHRVDPVEGPFFHAVGLANDKGRGVDVHRWVAFPRFTPVPERSWLERAVPLSVGGVDVRRLDSADELVLTTLHGPLTNSASSTRWPLDVVQLARHAKEHDPTFWDRVVTSADELRVGPMVADALAFCRAELAAAVPATSLDRLRSGPLDRGLAQH